MKKNTTSYFFSAALVISAVIIGGSIIYATKAKTPASDHMTIMDEDNNAYVVEKDKPLKLTVISDRNCDTCDPKELESILKMQTGMQLAVRRMDFEDTEAKTVLSDNKAEFLPYLLIDKDIEKHPNYTHLTHHLISPVKEGYILDLMKMGMSVGRYLNATYYAKEDSNAPKATTGKRDYDFGDVHLSDGKVSTAFVIKNEGKSPLEFLNANTSCGCTSVKVVLPNNSSPEYMMAGHQAPVKWKGVLAPGEEGRIIVYYNPNMHPDLNGAVTREVMIDTNDPNAPQLNFKIYVNQIANH